MARLMVLADDFTGAMDTGVQFAKLGVKTLVGTDGTSLLAGAGDAQVLVADTETRHMTPAQAHQAVFRLAREAREAGVPYLYKKTDSALRGNVGAELAAVLRAWGCAALPFVPAYPQMGRTTLGGIHYIDGVPVAQSAFGKDPFSPVLCSDVVQWLARQSDAPVIRAGGEPPGAAHIEVYDAQTDADLIEIVSSLERTGRLFVTAGCAGFASALARALAFEAGQAVENQHGSGKLVVLCGSVNPVTRAQIRYAADHGFRHVRLTPAQKLGLDRNDALQHRALVDRLMCLCRQAAPVIIDANDEGTETLAYAAAEGMTLADVRSAVSRSLGRLGRELMAEGLDGTLLITGGDTLMGFLSAWDSGSLRPVCEVAPGVVRAVFEADGKARDIITKSGGFGEERLFQELAARMMNEKGEE